MSQEQQIEQFATELKAVIKRAIAEYDLTLVSAVGCLEVIKLELFKENAP